MYSSASRSPRLAGPRPSNRSEARNFTWARSSSAVISAAASLCADGITDGDAEAAEIARAEDRAAARRCMSAPPGGRGRLGRLVRLDDRSLGRLLLPVVLLLGLLLGEGL